MQDTPVVNCSDSFSFSHLPDTVFHKNGADHEAVKKSGLLSP
jgi:hypothetical protein